jgi:hypothetical protein
MNPLDRKHNFVRIRGVLGLFYIVLGIVIGSQILHQVGLRFEAFPGVVLGLAMISLGVVRIRSALKLRSQA